MSASLRWKLSKISLIRCLSWVFRRPNSTGFDNAQSTTRIRSRLLSLWLQSACVAKKTEKNGNIFTKQNSISKCIEHSFQFCSQVCISAVNRKRWQRKETSRKKLLVDFFYSLVISFWFLLIISLNCQGERWWGKTH